MRGKSEFDIQFALGIVAKMFLINLIFVANFIHIANSLTCSCYAQGNGVYFSTIQQTSNSPCSADNTCVSSQGTGCFRIVGNSGFFNGTIGFCNAQYNTLNIISRTIGIPMQPSCDSIASNTTGVCYCDGGNLCNSQNGTVALISGLQSAYVSCKCYAHGNGSYFSAYRSTYTNDQCLSSGTCDAPPGTGCIRIYSNTTQFNGSMGFCGGMANTTVMVAANLSVANLTNCDSSNSRMIGVCYCDAYAFCNTDPMLNATGNWLSSTYHNELMADVETQQLLAEVVMLHKAVLRLERDKLLLQKAKLENDISAMKAEPLY